MKCRYRRAITPQALMSPRHFEPLRFVELATHPPQALYKKDALLCLMRRLAALS